ncbi:MAG: ferredoxin [Acidobacteria bacterium]|nr:MAG: ferredoxin [Acidobacteriota bacterium]
MEITFFLNGVKRTMKVEPHVMLVDLLRDQLGLTGTKKSCDMAVCGACTVLVDGMAVSSCTFPAFEIRGRRVLTIEGLAEDSLHVLQQAFIEMGGFQCGFCTPGMILLAKSLLDENPSPTEIQIREYMDGNICRCTGYKMIIESVVEASHRVSNDSRAI